MTGSGTENDPYIIDSWEEFKAHVSEAGVCIKIADGTIWNMNELEPAGCPTLTISAGDPATLNIDGNGVVINDLYLPYDNCFFKGNGGYGKKIIKGFNFFNCRCDGVLFDAHNGSYKEANKQFQIYDTVVTGIFNRQIFQSNHDMYRFFYLERCGINVKLTGNNYLSFGTGFDAVNSHFNIIGENNTEKFFNNYYTSSGYYYDSSSSCRFCNCYIAGELKNTTNLRFTVNNVYTNNIFNIKVCEGSEIYIIETSDKGCNLINSDKIENCNVHASDGNSEKGFFSTINYVSTTQLKNAEYLSSIGFPIGV